MLEHGNRYIKWLYAVRNALVYARLQNPRANRAHLSLVKANGQAADLSEKESVEMQAEESESEQATFVRDYQKGGTHR